MSIQSVIQTSSVGELVTLLEIDLTKFGEQVVRITPGTLDENPVLFRGMPYYPVPVECSGFSWNSSGSLPRPTLRISTVAGLLNSAVIEFNDLLGANVTRLRTFAEFLDDGENPDPDAILPVDIYRVERKVNQNKVFIEWELSTYIDNEGLQLPRRQVLRDACTHKYRRFDATVNEFNYDGVSCPYVGDNSFNSMDSSCDPLLDQCSKKLTGCRARFGLTESLPTRAFPGVARAR